MQWLVFKTKGIRHSILQNQRMLDFAQTFNQVRQNGKFKIGSPASSDISTCTCAQKLRTWLSVRPCGRTSRTTKPPSRNNAAEVARNVGSRASLPIRGQARRDGPGQNPSRSNWGSNPASKLTPERRSDRKSESERKSGLDLRKGVNSFYLHHFDKTLRQQTLK